MSNYVPGHLLNNAVQNTPDLAIRACHIGPDAAERLGAYTKDHLGQQGLVVADANTYAVGGEAVRSALDAAGKSVTEHLYGEETLDASDTLGDEVAAAAEGADFIVGIGAGTLSDLAKHAGTKLDRPVLLFATAASMNGYTSGIVALKVRGLKRTTSCQPATAIFADPAIVATAPQRMVASGVADFLSKCSAGADWRAAHFLRDEYYNEEALQYYDGVLEPVLASGERIGNREPEAVGLVLEALLLSGLSMLMAGSSSPASGGEHLISHFIDMKSALNGTTHDLHGVQVGVATVHCLTLWEKILDLDPSQLDIDALLDAQPAETEIDAWIEEDWGAIAPEVRKQWAEKSLNRDGIRAELEKFRDEFDALRAGVQRDLLPSAQVAEVIRASGGPTTPQDMNAPLDVYTDALCRARFIRNRFTVLDLAAELCIG